ncbi:MAG: thiamine-phosphate kinase, partial [Nitrosomonas sp.]|nr:thiamine-phosphate kinase [Nitrosomonas sp.]
AINCWLAGGDDYELCFTVPPINRGDIERLSIELSIPLTCIGKITAVKGLTVHGMDGSVLTQEKKGYDHFNS